MNQQTRVTEELKLACRRELQMLGAGLSVRDWLKVEGAYNQLRDRLHNILNEGIALSRTTPSASEELGAIAHLINVEPASMVTEEMKRAGTKVLLDIINGAGGGPEESVTAIYLAMSSMETKCDQ